MRRRARRALALVALVGSVIGGGAAGVARAGAAEAGHGGHRGSGGAEPAVVRAAGLPLGRPNAELSYDGGLFSARCPFDHAAMDDPIVFPGQPGLSHRHDFFGAVGVGASSTAAGLRRAGATTCDVEGDTASYWAPALQRDGVPIRPVALDAYYRVAPGVAPRSVRPFPAGLAMIAGDAHATRSLPTSIVGYGCGRAPAVTTGVPSCPPERPLTLRVTFPDCWNGRALDSPDHATHVAYSGRTGCPRGFPVALPRLTVVVDYPVSGDATGLAPASGEPRTAHADFLNAWDPAALRDEVTSCLARGVVCSVP